MISKCHLREVAIAFKCLQSARVWLSFSFFSFFFLQTTLTLLLTCLFEISLDDIHSGMKWDKENTKNVDMALWGKGVKIQFNSVLKFKEQTLDEFERSLLVESIIITSI